MDKISVGMLSLGCAKNQVDAEILMGTLERENFTVCNDPYAADVVIVNTCGFIESAKKESIEEILDLVKLKEADQIKRIVVTGCLAQRYKGEIFKELPEVDAVIGIGANGEIASLIKKMIYENRYVESFPDKEKLPLCGERKLSTPDYYAYLKISEGCSNHCTYCAIPGIRGKFRSRSIEDICGEAQKLACKGVKELILVAQDTTRYGLDIYGEYSLHRLLVRLCKIPEIHWIRILYCYPDALTDELLELIAREDKIVKYMDLPLQHVSKGILKTMNRTGGRENFTRLISKIRSIIPRIALRTTMITGFPGETEQDFIQLSEFVKEMRFDHLGCFAYSAEEGTPAEKFLNQIPTEIKTRRAEIITEMQMNIIQENGEARVGQTMEILIEGFDRSAGCWFGRSEMDAPDIDGKVFFTDNASGSHSAGTFINVKISDCIDGDLFAIPV